MNTEVNSIRPAAVSDLHSIPKSVKQNQGKVSQCWLIVSDRKRLDHHSDFKDKNLDLNMNLNINMINNN